MRLKTLEIQGYKSFAVKSIFQFDKGITAIVGPNGSGKSNISDAIRWVLGEQSYSNLRGQRTADMIFAGSSNRARMGMAAVSITLDNSDGSLPLDYNEITISRRAFRSGENEYLINNNRVRLKDVAEILARGGLARQTYTSIGQGTIDRALSLRAEERRQLFEEAAGITYHRQRRALTLRRLDETHSNLIRINDIVKEIEPRLKRLQRQVEKVEKHKTISLHLKGLLKVWYGYQWGQKQEALHQAKVRTTISTERQKENRNKLSQIEEKIKALRTQQTDIRAQLGGWHAESSTLHNQAEALQRELAVGEERARQLASQREEFITEIQLLEEQLKQQQAQVSQARQSLDEINQALQQAQNTLNTAQKNLTAHQQERQTLLHRQNQAASAAERAAHALTDRNTRLAQLAERNAELEAQKQEQQQAIEALAREKTQTEASLQTARAQLQQFEIALQTVNNQERETQQQHQALLEHAQTLTVKISEAEKTLASMQARYDLLDKLRNDMSGYHQGVKAVLQNKALPGIRGTVAQLLQVPAELETALEMALGNKLQNVVVDSWNNAETAIEHLKKTRSGRATFLPLDRIRPAPPLRVPQIEGVIGLATNLVTFDPQNRPAVESLLNRLLITTNLASARKAFDRLKGGFQIATQTGEIARSGGSVTGGETHNKQQGSMLSREREWRELPRQIRQLEAQRDTLKSESAENTAAQRALEHTLQQLAQQKQSLTHQKATVEKTINRQENTLSDLNNKIVWRKDLQIQADQEIVANTTRATEIRAEIERLTAEKTDADAQIAALQTQIDSLSAETLQAELNDAKGQVALIREKQQNQQALLRTYTSALNQLEAQRDTRQNRITALAQQRQALTGRLEAQQEEHAALLEALKTYTDQIEPAEVTLKKLETAQAEAEAEESKQRERLRRIETENHHYSLDQARRQDEILTLQRQIEDDFGLVQLEMSEDQVGQHVLPLQSVVTQLPTIEKLPEGIADDIRHLKVQLRQLGHVNPDAPTEYEELQERYNFLTSQMSDLETASSDLRKVIEELDKIIQEAFTKTFVAVAKEFQNYFKILFSGGEAQLILTNPDDIAHTGVNIVARPPDKRPQNLELLSGGERSLTAQALIFALLKTSPTPYCVFDEVDAMLDEANVDRFRQALADLSKDIQFIIITHNRKTIEIADTIYGISMGNDAVSRVVSLKLEDIPENAAEILA